MPSTIHPRFFPRFPVGTLGAALLLLTPILTFAQTAPKEKTPPASGSAELRASHAYEAARANPLELEAFLRRMPKGADLHYHEAGGIYAETFIKDGAEDGLCVDLKTHSFAPPAPACGVGQVGAAEALTNQTLYDALVDSFSMRTFVPITGTNGHDRFFDTFGKFHGTSSRHSGEWLDEIASRAAAQNEQYLEIMETPDFSHTYKIAYEVGWMDDLAKLRDALLAAHLTDDVAVAKKDRDDAEASRQAIEHCGTPQATPACKVKIRYIYQILRDFPKQQVFAQTLLGFEVATADPRFVGLTYVQPEDNTTPMADYELSLIHI